MMDKCRGTPNTTSQEPKSPKALVFDPSKPEQVTEEYINEDDSE